MSGRGLIALVAGAVLTTAYPVHPATLAQEPAALPVRHCSLESGYAVVIQTVSLPLPNSDETGKLAIPRTLHGTGFYDITHSPYPVFPDDNFKVIYSVCTQRQEENQEIKVLRIEPILNAEHT